MSDGSPLDDEASGSDILFVIVCAVSKQSGITWYKCLQRGDGKGQFEVGQGKDDSTFGNLGTENVPEKEILIWWK
jgi:hypothetical protein